MLTDDASDGDVYFTFDRLTGEVGLSDEDADQLLLECGRTGNAGVLTVCQIEVENFLAGLLDRRSDK